MGLSLPQNSFQLNFSSIYFMLMKRIAILTLMVCILITACTGQVTQSSVVSARVVPTQTFASLAYAVLPTATPKPKKYSPITPVATKTSVPTAIPTALTQIPEQDPERW